MGARAPGQTGADAVDMADNWDYVAFPYTYSTPIDVEEAELLEQNPDKVDRDDMEHLMHRVLVTARQVRTIRASFDSEIRRRVELASASRLRQVLDPEQAVRYLTDEQVENIFDSHRRNQLAYLRGEVDRILQKNLATTQAMESTQRALREGKCTAEEALASALDALRRFVDETDSAYGNLT